MAKELKRNAMTKGNVVEEYKIGNTKIKILDTYLPKTQEENDAVISSFENTLGRILGGKVTITRKEY